MSVDGSKSSVLVALAGNTAVMVAKFAVFFMTGSGAILSEAIHTLADVMNQGLLLIGIVRSKRAPDRRYRYGYGPERFVWALISAVGIFFLGCGVTIYHGISSLLHPHAVESLGWAISVLLFSLVVEGSVLFFAARKLWARKGEVPFWRFVRTQADPSAVAVLLEDSAACLGILIALAAISLALWTGEPWWDAVGSIAIGVLLGLVALWLIARNRELLVGRAAPDEATAKVIAVLKRHRMVEEIVEVRSRVVDTETFDFEITLEFEGERFATLLEADLRTAWAQIDDYADFQAWAAAFANEVVERLGDEIDAIEAEIREVVPQAKLIDIEPH